MEQIAPNRIRELRKARGWTAKVLAERSGLWVAAVYRYERNVTPKLPAMRALADALGVTVDELFPRAEVSA